MEGWGGGQAARQKVEWGGWVGGQGRAGQGRQAGGLRPPHLASGCVLPSAPILCCPISTRRMRSCHPWSGNQSYGFLLKLFSRLRLPLRKKSRNCGSSGVSPSRILMAIWNENMSLCRSNRPRQV